MIASLEEGMDSLDGTLQRAGSLPGDDVFGRNRDCRCHGWMIEAVAGVTASMYEQVRPRVVLR